MRKHEILLNIGLLSEKSGVKPIDIFKKGDSFLTNLCSKELFK